MTFGVTPEGFRAKRFEDIITDLGDNLKTQLNIDIDSDPDSVAKVLTNIYALPLAEEWALTQSLQSMFDIDKAEGVHLDNLVGYLGLRRLQAAKSAGLQYITSTAEVTIPALSEFKDTAGKVYNNPTAILVAESSCIEATYEYATTVVVGTVYTIVVNGITSSVTSLVGESIEEISQRLVDAISIAPSNRCTATYSIVSDTGVLVITSDDDKDPATIATSNNFLNTELTSIGKVEYSIAGDISVPPLTVIVPPPISTLSATTNRYAYSSGRLEETDEELRNRHSASLSAAGGATVEAIRADLLRVEGVTTVIVLENSTTETSEGLPPKSFLAIVKGGAEEDIAESIWLTKPAGIESYGDIAATVVDSQGITRVVKYSTPLNVFVHVEIAYDIYQEEADEFPIDGEAQMVQQILQYGEGLEIGEDVIPQRFASQIFKNIGGLESVVLKIQSTVSQYDTPDPLSWQYTTLPIDALSEANFDVQRITFEGGA